MDARRVYSVPTDRRDGVICNQRVILNCFYSAKHPLYLFNFQPDRSDPLS